MKNGHGQANVYHPFPDSNAVWTWQWCVGPPPACGSAAYFIKGDTVINSILYHKIYYYGQSSNLVGGIRNEVSSKKVYFICLKSSSSPPPHCGSQSSEKILYDFNAGVGDTVFYGNCGISWKVNSIDSIKLLDGTTRKVFKSNFGPAMAIEGIGNNGSFLCGTQDGMTYLSLLCFQKDGMTLYSSPPSPYNSSQNPCMGPVAVHEKDEAILHTRIAPNPFRIQTTLQTDNFLHNATLTVDNCFGQAVTQIKNINGQKIVFYRNNLPSGIYFIRLIQDNKTIATNKLVITDN